MRLMQVPSGTHEEIGKDEPALHSPLITLIRLARGEEFAGAVPTDLFDRQAAYRGGIGRIQ